MNNTYTQINYKFFAWLIFILGSTFYCYTSVLEVLPDVMLPQLMDNFHLNAFQVSNFSTWYFTAFLLVLIPGGRLLDYFGEQRVLPLALLVTSIGSILFASTNSYHLAILGRAITGIGSSFGLMGIVYLVTKWFSPSKHGLYIGLAIMIGFIGGLLQPILVSSVLNYSWRMVVYFIALLAIVLALTLFFVLNSHIYFKTIHPSKTSLDHISLKTACITIIVNPANWLLALYGGIMYLPTGIFGAIWGNSFLEKYFPFAAADQTAKIISLIYLGWIIGSPLFGYLSDYIQQRKPIIIFSSLGLLILLLLIVWLHLTIFSMSCIMLLIGLCSAGGALFFTMVVDNNKASIVATAFGFVNALALLPNTLGQPLFSLILDRYAITLNKNHLTVYPLSAFQHAIGAMLFIIALAACIALFFIKETYPKKHKALPI